MGRVLGLLCRSFFELPAASYNHHEATTSLLQFVQQWNSYFNSLEEDLDEWEGFWVCCATASSSFLQHPTTTMKPPRVFCSSHNNETIIPIDWKKIWMIWKGSGFVVPQLLRASCSFLQLPTTTTEPPRVFCSSHNNETIISTHWKKIWKIWKGSGFVVPQLPWASCSFLQQPWSRRNVYNDENDSFDWVEGDLDDWKSLGACYAAASPSFLELPPQLLAAPYSYHEAIAMRATRELVISTKWKDIWTVGKGSELVRCCFLQLPRWKLLLW
jgi:hypothetical protein